jgi:hypothetical protein
MKKVEIIKVGDKVRSFDFDCKEVDTINSCFVEGIVESIEGHPMGGGGEFVKFIITKKVFSGEETDRSVGEYNWVPQNGQKQWTGKLTNNVIKIG